MSRLARNPINIPEDISITSVYPNPFNPVTNIEFSLDEKSNVYISIYDINGRSVDLLAENEFNRGFHNVMWDASEYPSGVYFVKIISNNISVSQKIILIK